MALALWKTWQFSQVASRPLPFWKIRGNRVPWERERGGEREMWTWTKWSSVDLASKRTDNGGGPATAGGRWWTECVVLTVASDGVPGRSSERVCMDSPFSGWRRRVDLDLPPPPPCAHSSCGGKRVSGGDLYHLCGRQEKGHRCYSADPTQRPLHCSPLIC